LQSKRHCRGVSNGNGTPFLILTGDISYFLIQVYLGPLTLNGRIGQIEKSKLKEQEKGQIQIKSLPVIIDKSI
jgi:hypothetical protein